VVNNLFSYIYVKYRQSMFWACAFKLYADDSQVGGGMGENNVFWSS
jgi:hypothetical protein